MKTKVVAKKFIKHLKEIKVQFLVCNLCGYRQGHPIIYCPKCPGKMRLMTESEYTYFCRKRDPENAISYKWRCAKFTDEQYISQADWKKVVKQVIT